MRIRPRGLALGPVAVSPALAARIALGAFGAWVASIGIRALLRGHPFAANAPVGRWLVGGVLAHDAVIAPTVFVLGAVSVRLAGPRVRQALAAILLIGGSIIIVGLPDVLRKGHNSNPTVTPLDYTRNLVIVLSAVVGGVALMNTAIALRQRRQARGERDEPAPEPTATSDDAPDTPVATGYFHVRSVDDRWTLVSPQGERFVNIGIAPAAATDLPYCIPLRPIEIESRNGRPAYQDPTSAAFDEYCDYLARTECLPHAEDPNLIGYLVGDGLRWDSHATRADFPGLRDLDDASRASALGDLATAYYETVARHIRGQDPNHLILGELHGVRAGLPEPVLRAMGDHVDVLSVQMSTGADEQEPAEVIALLDRCHELTGKPILMAVGAQHDVRTLTALIERPWCLCWNRRGYGETIG